MPQDAMQLKEKIIWTLNRNGPSLPVHIAKATDLSILFASAFLSELASEKRVKISNMKVGSSPVYFLPQHKHLLEKFSQHLKSKEKDAYLLLKENKFLADKNLHPAISVALRDIKDFAIPFERNGELFWRYFTVPEEEFEMPEIKKEPEEETIIIKEAEPEVEIEEKEAEEVVEGEKEEIEEKPELIIIEEIEEPKVKQKKEAKALNIFEKKEKKSRIAKKPAKKKLVKHNEKFFDKIKDFLGKKSIEIFGIEGFNKNELVIKIKENKIEKLLIAYNKKRITEADLINAAKKASSLGLPYTILSLGEMPKKMNSLIDAVKNLSSMEKIE